MEPQLWCEQRHLIHPTGFSTHFPNENRALFWAGAGAPLSYLQESVKGLQASVLGWPINSNSVDIDTFFQEAI